MNMTVRKAASPISVCSGHPAKGTDWVIPTHPFQLAAIPPCFLRIRCVCYVVLGQGSIETGSAVWPIVTAGPQWLPGFM